MDSDPREARWPPGDAPHSTQHLSNVPTYKDAAWVGTCVALELTRTT